MLNLRSRSTPLQLLIILPLLSTQTFAKELSPENKLVSENILLYQRNNGGWPKNYDRAARLSKNEIKTLLSKKGLQDTTFDNGATYREMRHLAGAYKATSDDRYRQAFLQGLDFTLAAQYANGGWPQFYPKASGYHAHITFNDDAMIGVMRLLKEIAHENELYTFVDEARRQKCAAAIEMGLQCILKCQIEVEGKKTAWCAQHNSKTFAPAKARSYELPSLSGSESVAIIRYLMEIDQPSPKVVAAVQGAVVWLNEAKLTGIRVVKKADKSSPKEYDKIVIKDPSATPLWARFYEIGTNKPIFCSRDGVPRDELADISYERRNGYSWLGNRAAELLAKEYPAWQKKQAAQ